MKYIFESPRLGFRNWEIETDLPSMAQLCQDAEVMRFFPKTLSQDETRQMLIRFYHNYELRDYTYYAVEELVSCELIGFIGIMYQTYEASFTPCIDIGWRLHKRFWGKGYATEGAKACLKHAFDTLGIEGIKSIASVSNLASIQVMKKIGMSPAGEFEHPLLVEFPQLKRCVLYEISKNG